MWHLSLPHPKFRPCRSSPDTYNPWGQQTTHRGPDQGRDWSLKKIFYRVQKKLNYTSRLHGWDLNRGFRGHPAATARGQDEARARSLFTPIHSAGKGSIWPKGCSGPNRRDWLSHDAAQGQCRGLFPCRREAGDCLSLTHSHTHPGRGSSAPYSSRQALFHSFLWLNIQFLFELYVWFIGENISGTKMRTKWKKKFSPSSSVSLYLLLGKEIVLCSHWEIRLLRGKNPSRHLSLKHDFTYAGGHIGSSSHWYILWFRSVITLRGKM